MGLLSWPGVSLAGLDICGCTGSPNLGAFDAADEATYPPGTTRVNDTITIPLPPDGKLIFSSFTVGKSPRGFDAFVLFARNDANTPVTLLVTGDVTLACCAQIIVSGNNGISGTSGLNGVGGLGGPGGFRGGDGAYQLVNFASDGGAGFGPGGGAAGIASSLTHGGNGTFLGVPELLPLVGGSGGGGGPSNSGDLNCSGGGGGGGGGALVIAANGTITLNHFVFADGGSLGGAANFNCSRHGGGASGGAIRFLADTITGTGSLFARGGAGGSGSGTPGAIRLEAFTNTLSASSTSPVATRAPAPGPVENPLTPTVAIKTVAGGSVPEPPLGYKGNVDVVLSAPGVVTIELETLGVPSGTVVEVTVKPRVGGDPITLPVTLGAPPCTSDGLCQANVDVDLPGGAFVIEARATFQTP